MKPPDKEQIQDYLTRAQQAPRLTAMFNEFSQLATGKKGSPVTPVDLSPELLQHDSACLEYAAARDAQAGVFNAHFIASLPFALEEQCRFGAAALAYLNLQAKKHGRRSAIYTLGDASGVTSRTLAKLSPDAIRTLTCSPNPENEQAFHAANPGSNADFSLGPFFDVNPENLEKRGLTQHAEGFDLIVEDTTFQMYGPERLEPIYLAKRNLRDDGILVLVEKIMQTDHDEYARREYQKDWDFKARFFDHQQIEDKRKTIVNKMETQEVTLDELVTVLKVFFDSAVVTWNTGNFYTVMASNSNENLEQLVCQMIEPAIPPEFCYLPLPHQLFGDPANNFQFRPAAL